MLNRLPALLGVCASFVFSFSVHADYLSGQIVAAEDGRSIGGAARVFDDTGREWDFWVDGDGNWSSAGSDLPADTNLYVTTGFLGEDMGDEGWEGDTAEAVLCHNLTCIPSLSPVSFSAGIPYEGVNFSVGPIGSGGRISGNLSDGAEPVFYAGVAYLNENGLYLGEVRTDAAGNWSTPLLANGFFYIRTSSEPNGLGRELWNGGEPANTACIPKWNCDDSSYVVANGTQVSVPATDVGGIDFILSDLGGGRISGRVYDQIIENGGDTFGLTDIGLTLFQFNGVDGYDWFGNTQTDPDGNYTFAGLADGQFKVIADGVPEGYSQDSYGESGCCDPNAPDNHGTTITITSGVTDVAAADIALDFSGTRIVGTVTRSGTGEPVSNNDAYFSVDLYDDGGNGPYDGRGTNVAGQYQFILGPNGFMLSTSHDTNYHNLINEAWTSGGGVPCSNDCNPFNIGGEAFTVADGESFIANFELDTGTVIEGFVFATDGGAPIADVEVCAERAADGWWAACAWTDGSGFYRLAGLEARDDWTVLVNNTSGQPYLKGPSTPVSTLGGSLSDINFNLEPGYFIAGTITDADSGLPVDGVGVCIHYTWGDFAGVCGGTDASGNYQTSPALPPGGDYVAYAIGADQGYAYQMYDGLDCANNFCDFSTGTPIALGPGNASGIDFNLNPAGQITGTVSDGGGPLAFGSGRARIYDAGGALIAQVDTDENGVYRLGGLAPGSYYVLGTGRNSSLIDELWTGNGSPGIHCPRLSCGTAAGAPVIIDSNETEIADLVLDVGSRIIGSHTFDNSIPGYGEIFFYDAAGNYAGFGFSGGDGNYQSFSGYPTGTWYASNRFVADGIEQNVWQEFMPTMYLDSVENGVDCGFPCDIVNTIPSASGFSTDGSADAILNHYNYFSQPPAAISGTLLANDGSPVGGAVRVFDGSGNEIDTFWVDGDGNWSTYDLGSGAYYLVTSYTWADVIDDTWDGGDGSQCYNLTCDILAGTPVVIQAGVPVDGIDFRLDDITGGGFINGRLTDELGNGLYYVNVEVLNRNGDYLSSVRTDRDGYYSTPLLANDDFYLRTSSEPNGLARELYRDPGDSVDPDTNYTCPWAPDCWDPGIVVTNGLPIEILDANYDGADFVLKAPATGGQISGRVFDEIVEGLGSPFPLPEVYLVLFDGDGNWITDTNTDPEGNYTFAGLADGSYQVFVGGQPEGYAQECYNNVACDWGTDFAASGADLLVISGGNAIPNVDIGLDYSGTRIVGTITHADSGLPVPSNSGWMGVDLFNDVGDGIDARGTNIAGQYQVPVDPGDYYLVSAQDFDFHGLIDQVFSGIDCGFNCDPLSGTLVSVGDGETYIANFALNPALVVGGTLSAGGSPVVNDGFVTVWDGNSSYRWLTGAQVDNVGNWQLRLPPGDYHLQFSTWGAYEHYVHEIQDGGQCPDMQCLGFDWTQSGVAPLSVGTDLSGIDADLELGVIFEGVLRDEKTLEPIPSLRIYFYNDDIYLSDGYESAFVYTIRTDETGYYRTPGLPVLNYLPFSTGYDLGYGREFYNDQKCDPVDCDNALANRTAVSPLAGSTTTIEFDLIARAALSGQVTDGTDPLGGVRVRVWDTKGNLVDETWTDGSGNYYSNLGGPGHAAADYYITANAEDQGFVAQIYGSPNTDCPQEYCVQGGTPGVSPLNLDGADIGGIDFSLNAQNFATISGTVLAVDGNEVGGGVRVFDALGNEIDTFWVEGGGAWSTYDLPDGTYYLVTSYTAGANVIDDGWDGVDGWQCVNLLCNLVGAPEYSPVVISDGTPVSGIDFRLDYIPEGTGGRFFGQVVDAADTPLNYVGLTVLNANGDYLTEVRTNPDGFFETPSLPDGDYYLRTNYAPDGLIDELWRDFESTGSPDLNWLCVPRWECDDPDYVVTNGLPLSISSGDVGTDFVLDTPDPLTTATISGTVYDLFVEDSNTPEFEFPMVDVGVQLYVQNPEGFYDYYSDTITGVQGNFTFAGLPDGTYKVFVEGVPENYNAASFGALCCDKNAEGTPIVLVAGDSHPNTDVGLPYTGGSRIIGTITNADTGEPVSSNEAWMGVDLYNEAGDPLGGHGTNVAGQYQIQVEPGNYYLATTHDLQFHGLIDQLYDGDQCGFNCDPIANGASTHNVPDSGTLLADFALNPALLVSGTLNAGGSPVVNEGWVNVWEGNSNYWYLSGTGVDESGNWQLRLPPGDYHFQFGGSGAYEHYIQEIQGDVQCPDMQCLGFDWPSSGFAPLNISADISGLNADLEQGVIFEGVLRDEITNDPIPNLRIYFYNDDIFLSQGYNAAFIYTRRTDESGYYRTPGLPVLNYLPFSTGFDLGYGREYYDDQKCDPVDCDEALANRTAVSPLAGSTTTVEFNLIARAVFSGQVLDDGANPIEGARVRVWDTKGNLVDEVWTDEFGNYFSNYGGPGHAAADYFITANAEDRGFIAQVYNSTGNADCPQEFCVQGGTPPVAATNLNGSDRVNVDFSLNRQQFATIWGNLLRSGDFGPVGGAAQIFNAFGDHVTDAWADGNTGQWISEPLPDGVYYVRTNYLWDGFLNELWDGVDGTPCVAFLCDVTTGDPVIIENGFVYSGGLLVPAETSIDFVVDAFPEGTGGRISGELLDDNFAPGSNGINFAGVIVYNSAGDYVTESRTLPDGRYETRLLPDGDYFLSTAYEPDGLQRELFNGGEANDDINEDVNTVCSPYWACDDPAVITDPLASTPITIAGADFTNATFVLKPPASGGRIEGVVYDQAVTDQGGYFPLPNVNLVLFDSDGNWMGDTNSEPDGSYTFAGLPDGGYQVFTGGVPEGYAQECYADVACDWGTDFSTSGATLLTISSGNTVLDVDLGLDFSGTRIIGTVTRSDTGEPVSSDFGWFGIEAFNSAGEGVDTRGTNIAGQYQIPLGNPMNPSPQSFFLNTTQDVNFHGLTNEVFDDNKCYDNCNPLDVVGEANVTVNDGETFLADFVLDPAPVISGTVTEQGTATGLSDIQVCVQRYSDGQWISCVRTDGDGNYQIKGLAPQTGLRVFTNDTSGRPYVGQSVDTDFIGDLDIDFDLELGFLVTGQVTDSSTGEVIPPYSVAEVRLYGADRGVLSWASVNENGQFTIVASPDGGIFYAVATNYDGPLIDELWNADAGSNIHCPRASCELTTLGSPISTNAGDVTTGVDIEMDLGSLITGTLTLNGQTPPAGTFLFFYDSVTGNYAGSGLTGEWSPTGYINGTQDFRSAQGFPAGGSYVMSNRFAPDGIDQGFNPDYVATLYLDSDADGLECGEPCNVLAGGTALATNGTDNTVTNPYNWYTNAVSFSGTVSSSAGGVLGDVEVTVRSVADDSVVGTAWSDWNTGYWQIDEVPLGEYYVVARGEDQQHVSQLSLGVACPQTYCPTANPTTYDTSFGDQTGIDFVLEPQTPVTVSGTLLGSGGNFVGGGVRFIDPFGNEYTTAWTQNEDGAWSVDLPEGTWYLLTGYLWEGFVDDIWDGANGAQCPALACGFAATGTPVITDGVNPVGGVDLRVDPLATSSRIHGNVSGPDGAIHYVAVAVHNSDGRYLFEMRTDTDGNYRSSPLPDGEYYLRTSSEPDGLARQLYSGVDCIPRWDCDDRTFITSLGTAVDTSTGDQFGVDFLLSPLGGGQISGTVFDAALGTGFPLPDVYLVLFDETGNWLLDTQTDPQGNYTFAGLESGNYRVFAEGVPEGYAQECFSDVACDWNTDFRTTGTLVAIEIGVTDTATADIALDYVGGPRIVGTVTRSDTLEPVSSNFGYFNVNVFDDAGNGIGGTGPNVAGQYQLYLPTAGNYQLSTDHDTNFHNLVNEAWNSTGGAQCFGDCNPFNVAGSEVIDLSIGGTFVADFELDPAAEIVGTVTEEGTGTPLGGITMCLAPQVGNPWYACSDTAEDGTFAFRGLNAGNDYVPFVWNVNGQGYARETWQDKPCCSGNWIADGDAITVALGASVTADFALAPSAAITGVLTDSATGTPISGVPVWLVTPACDFIERGNTNSEGRYTLSGFEPGTYYVAAQADRQGYVRQLYPDIKRYNSCDPDIADGQAIPVDPLAVINDIDFALDLGGSISGFVSDASGVLPFNQAQIRLYDTTGNFLQAVNNREAGDGYRVGGLLPGSYHVVLTSRFGGLIDERYDDIECPRNACDLALGVPVIVAPEEDVTGIDAELSPGAVLSGQVTDANGPVEGYFVDFYTAEGLYAGFARADASGNFITPAGLPDGDYLMSNQWFPTPDDPQPVQGGYLPQVWKADGSFGECGDPCNLLLGDPITVSGGADVGGLNLVLATGQTLSGQVTADSGATPLQGIEVRLLSSIDGSLVRSTTTDASGAYAFEGLPSTGEYYLRTLNTDGYGDLLYDTPTDDSCNPSCDPLLGGLISMAGPVSIDFDLVTTPVIQGTVTLPNGTDPAPGVIVKAYNSLGSVVASTLTNASGDYTLANLWSGTFYVRTHNTAGYLDDLYSGVECGAACDVLDGIPINLTPSGTSGKDLQLRSAAVISGVVTDGVVPLPGVTVELYRDTGAFVKSTLSDGSGAYSLNGLSAGSYHVVTRNGFGYVDEGAGGETCQSTCAPTSTTPVPVAANATVPVGFELAYGGEISGNVQGDGSPLVGVTIRAYNDAGVQIASTTTDAGGNYLIRGLVDGDVFLRTANAAPYRNQRFAGLACDTFCDVLAGTAVTASLGGLASGIDFTLEAGYSISGNVSNADTGSGIPGVRVEAYDGAGLLAGSAVALTGGAFEIDGLPDGDYRLKTLNGLNYVDRVLGGDTCTPETCEIGTGSLNVIGGADIAGVSIALSPGNTTGGYVTDTEANPLETGAAWLYSATGAFLKTAAINSGLFSFSGLADGTYFVLVKNDLGLVDQLYANIDCPDGSCDITSGTPIEVGAAPAAPAEAPSTLESNRVKMKLEAEPGDGRVTFGLERGTRIGGNVSTADGPVQFVNVYIFDTDGDIAAVAVTDGLGDFETDSGLPPGSWYIATQAPGQSGAGNGLIDEVYENFECLGDCDPVGLGTLVSTPNPGPVNIELASGDDPISGTVVSEAGATPLGQVTIEVYDDLGTLVKQAGTNGLGEYTVEGLPNGDYTLVARALAGNYGAILYDGLYCDGGCDVTVGMPVPTGAVINFQLPDDNCPNVDNPGQEDSDRNGRGDACELPVVADRADVHPSVIIGVGSEIVRGAIVHANVKLGDQVLISRNADIGAGCRIGDRVTIGQNTLVGAGCEIGDDSELDREGVYGVNLAVGTGSYIGKNAEVGDNVTIGSDVDISRNVFIADGVCVPDGSSYGKDSVITDTNLCD